MVTLIVPDWSNTSLRFPRFASLPLIAFTIVLARFSGAEDVRTATAATEAAVALPARLWAGGIVAAPRQPLTGDVDGDGRTDVLVMYPGSGSGSGIIDVALTSLPGKPRFPLQARTGFGEDLLIAACGRFTGTSGRSGGSSLEVLAVSRDGSLHLASQPGPDGRFARAEAFPPPAPRLPGPPAFALALRGRTMDSVLLADAKGNLLHLTFRQESRAFEAVRLRGRIANVAQIALEPEGRAFFWTDRKGSLFRSAALTDAAAATAAAAARVETRLILRGAPGEMLAVGRFSGAADFDVVLGQRLLPGGDPSKSVAQNALPGIAQRKGDFRWLAGDLDADGRDDLIRVRRSGERFTGDDVLVHFFRPPSAPDDLASSSGDGLLDSWKRGTVKPGGLDLAALGCRVGRKEVIVEVQRIENVPEDLVKREIERAAAYYSRIGITLIPIFREPIPLSDASRPWQELGEKYHPARHRGVTHWMLVVSGGGGQSGQMEDRGSCGSHALYATFLHEFGHQLGLDHTGHWGPAWCPTYPSLMNYAYSYQLGGKPEEIGYSDGRLASMVINERELSETLPLPMEKVAFLAGPPYHYRLRAGADGRSTLIDWNWNGIFGERHVSGDINYGYSTTGGLRHTIGKTYAAPVLAATGTGKRSRLLMFSSLLPVNAPIPPSDLETKARSLSREMPGRLLVRQWEGKDAAADGMRWGTGVVVAPDGVIGDASAASLGGAVWIAYPTAEGVELRPVTGEGGTLRTGEKILVPGTSGAQPTLAALDGKLALLLWRDEKTPVGFRLLTARGNVLKAGPETALSFLSRTPVGAVAGAKEKGSPTLWVGLFQDRDEKRTFSGQVRCFALQKDDSLRRVSEEWVGGDNGGQRGQSRPVLLWQAEPALNRRGGQLWFLAAGLFGNNRPIACHYVSTRVADEKVNGGWLQRRYYDEWTQSRSAPGVCFFRGEMIFAARWYGNVRGTENDNLFVAFFGRGFESEPMGDFDDIGFIRDIGLSHSILYRAD